MSVVRELLVAVAAFVTLGWTSAHAVTFYNFTFTMGEEITIGGSSYSGLFEVEGNTIIGVTGTSSLYGNITGIAPPSVANNNLFYYPAEPYVDFFGVGFWLENGHFANIYYVEGAGYIETSGVGSSYGSLTVSEAPLATPLPAALPLFATILAGGGVIAWRRKRKATSVT